MSDVVSVTTTPSDVRLSERGAISSSRREDYDGVSCRPTTVAPGPESASRLLKLRCKLDTFYERTETRIRRFAWRCVGKADKIASRVGMGGFYRHIPVVRGWRTPTPIVAPIFMVGAERSGTTILGKVLGHQGDVMFLSEARPMWYRAVPDVDERKFHWANGQPQGRLYLDETDYSEEAKASLEHDFGCMMTRAGRRRLMEKMPINLFRVRWLNAMWPDAKFIQIMRDPFSTTDSKMQCWPSIDEKQLPYLKIRRTMYTKLFPELTVLLSTITTPYEWYLFEWRVDTEEGERLKNMFTDRYRVVQLEEVQRNPETALTEICDFTGLRFSKRLRRAYRTMLDQRIRLAKPQLDRARCAEILGSSADRWGYQI